VNTARWAILENITIMLCVTVIILAGMHWFDSFKGMWSMIMLLFINTEIRSAADTNQGQ